MKMKLEKMDCRRGAPMGRPINISEPLAPVQMHLQRVLLDSGGYDNGGAYWGQPGDIWRAWGDGRKEQQEIFLRAPNRTEAKQHVSQYFRNASFYR